MRVTTRLTAQAFADLCGARTLLRLRRRVSIREAAAAARLSPFQFIRRFRAVFGETPHPLRIATLYQPPKK